MNATPDQPNPAETRIVIVDEILSGNARRFVADNWEVTRYTGPRGDVEYLRIFRTGVTQPIAAYAGGTWTCVRYEGTTTADRYYRGLLIAREALRELGEQLAGSWQEDPGATRGALKAAIAIVDRATDAITDEVDL